MEIFTFTADLSDFGCFGVVARLLDCSSLARFLRRCSYFCGGSCSVMAKVIPLNFSNNCSLLLLLFENTCLLHSCTCNTAMISPADPSPPSEPPTPDTKTYPSVLLCPLHYLQIT